MAVVIKLDAEQNFEGGSPIDVSSMSGDQVKEKLLASGLWPFIKQRPIDVVANPDNEPKAIFISAFDSSPLAPDYDYVLHGRFYWSTRSCNQ